METTKMPMNEQNVPHVHDIILFNNKGKWSCDICRKMPRTEGNCANEIKLILI